MPRRPRTSRQESPSPSHSGYGKMSNAEVIRMLRDEARRRDDEWRQENEDRRREDAERRREEADRRQVEADQFATLIATLRPAVEVVSHPVNPGFCLVPDMSAAIENFTGQNGQSLGAGEWLQFIESTGNCYNWPDLVKLEMARTHLTGAARAWYLYRHEELVDWASFRVAFSAAFAGQVSAPDRWKLMMGRTQSQEENVYTYVYEKLRLCKDVGLTFGETQTQLIIGIYSRSLSSSLSAREYHSEDELVQHIRTLEEIGRERSARVLATRKDVAFDRCQATAAIHEQAAHQMKKELVTLHVITDGLRAENTALQVNVATLQSQISSISSQHLALQLASSQLTVEKEELVKSRDLQLSAHEQLLLDQVNLQTMHEQLSSEYEGLVCEREGLNAALRDSRHEVRDARELCATHEQAHAELQRNSGRLSEDFRILFAASEKLKTGYRSLQEEYRSLCGETGSLKLRHMELLAEAASRSDRITMLEVELSKVNNLCQQKEKLEEKNVTCPCVMVASEGPSERPSYQRKWFLFDRGKPLCVFPCLVNNDGPRLAGDAENDDDEGYDDSDYDDVGIDEDDDAVERPLPDDERRPPCAEPPLSTEAQQLTDDERLLPA